MKIQSIERALKILHLFNYSRSRWGITEIANAMGLSKGTAYNIVHTLQSQGFLQQEEETKKYRLGPNLFTLGTIMAGTLEINQKAAGPAQKLAAQTELICRVALWDQDAALVTIEMVPQQLRALGRRIGPRVVAYCSAIGRALLAYLEPRDLCAYLDKTKMIAYTPQTITDRDGLLKELEQTKARGYAVNNQELGRGWSSIAAPIFKADGRSAAAISLTGDPQNVLGVQKDMLINQLLSIADRISQDMGFIFASPDVASLETR